MHKEVGEGEEDVDVVAIARASLGSMVAGGVRVMVSGPCTERSHNLGGEVC